DSGTRGATERMEDHGGGERGWFVVGAFVRLDTRGTEVPTTALLSRILNAAMAGLFVIAVAGLFVIAVAGLFVIAVAGLFLIAVAGLPTVPLVSMSAAGAVRRPARAIESCCGRSPMAVSAPAPPVSMRAAGAVRRPARAIRASHNQLTNHPTHLRQSASICGKNLQSPISNLPTPPRLSVPSVPRCSNL